MPSETTRATYAAQTRRTALMRVVPVLSSSVIDVTISDMCMGRCADLVLVLSSRLAASQAVQWLIVIGQNGS